MEQWLAPALILLAIVGVLVYLVWRSSRRAEPARAESYYGPLPEREAERAEMTDPAQFGQVTPGAVTPAAAGSTEAYYQSTGVGRGGPEHLSGPPPMADTHPVQYDQQRNGGMGHSRPVPLIAAGGAALGLGLFVLIRRLTRRRSRIEELRDRARRAARTAQHRAADVGGRAAELRQHVDDRATAGSGLALLASAMVLAAIRRRRERREGQRRAEEARAAAEAAMHRGWSRFRLGLGTLKSGNGAARVGTLTREAREQLPTTQSSWLTLGGALGLAVLVGLLIGRARRRPEADWWTGNVPSSAPSREAPASP
jgi:hypothetical protein